MNIVANFEHRASSSRGKHEGESSFALCDRLGRTRDNSQRQLPTDHDYAVPTREYQTDQSSLKTAPATARSVLEKKQRQLQKQPHRFRSVDTVTPYQGDELIETTSLVILAGAKCLDSLPHIAVRNVRRRSDLWQHQAPVSDDVQLHALLKSIGLLWNDPLNWHTRDGRTLRERKRAWRDESDIHGSSNAWP
jgi:hypothetical protein